jgi:hypothetical protein
MGASNKETRGFARERVEWLSQSWSCEWWKDSLCFMRLSASGLRNFMPLNVFILRVRWILFDYCCKYSGWLDRCFTESSLGELDKWIVDKGVISGILEG